MKRLLFFLFLFFASIATASADAVNLLQASSRTGSYHGYQWQDFEFDIRVDNIAYHKEVTVWYIDADGQWKSLAATYAHDIDGNQEMWHANWQRMLSRPGCVTLSPLDLVFNVVYKVAGQTYVDDRYGQQYYLPAGSGELITPPVLADGATAVAPYSVNGSSYPGYFTVGVLVKNLAYHKRVAIHYTYDNWRTTHIGYATFQPSRTYGYSYVTYPNANGVEYWLFRTEGPEAQNPSATEVKYAVGYTVGGQTYWDNNFGQDYTVQVQHR